MIEEKTNFSLECHNLNSSKDIIAYKDILRNFDGYDVFYKIDLINTNTQTNEQKKYFILKDKSNAIVLMPFIQRTIPINTTSPTIYYDVVSPYGYSGPLFKENLNLDTLIVFWKLIDNWYKENNIISEFIRFNLDGNQANYSGLLIATLTNVKGPIEEDKESQWNNFIPKVRNNYRKGLNNELEATIFEEGIPESAIEVFYSIYIGTMDRNNADDTYYFSLSYFKKFILNNPKNCSLIIIYKDRVAISTELILLNNKNMYSFLGGTVADYFSYRPNDFLKIEAMDWGRKKGFENYILGGGRKDFDGLYKYKKTFFPKENDAIYYTGRKIINQKIYIELCIANNINLKDINSDNILKISEGYFPKYREPRNN